MKTKQPTGKKARKWTVKPYLTPFDDSDPFGVFSVEEVRQKLERLDAAALGTPVDTQEEYAALDARDQAQNEAMRLIAHAPLLQEMLADVLTTFEQEGWSASKSMQAQRGTICREARALLQQIAGKQRKE